MERWILTYIVLNLAMISCSRELPERQVPSLVQNTFETRIGNVKDVDWEKNGRFYVVEFEKEKPGADHKMMIDSLGKIVMYKYEIETSELPVSVSNSIKSDYRDYKVDEAEKVDRDGDEYYQVELENGKLKHHLVYSENGTINSNINYWD